MSNGAYAGLRLAARASNPDPDNDPNNEPDDDGDESGESRPPKGKKKKDQTQMNTDTSASALAAAEQAGVAKGAQAANQRFSAVLASEHYKGREKLAAKLLDNFNLSADDIIGALAEAPAGGAQASNAADPEDAARQEMQAALAANANSNIDANGSGAAEGKDKQQNAAALWAQAQASLNPRGRR